MNPGDLVIHEYYKSIGILLEVRIDQKLMKNPFSVPWVYRVLWRDGVIKEHDMGTLRRVAVHKSGEIMKNKKEKQVNTRSKKTKTLEDGKITNCPTCGVDLNGNESCAYITCPCAPRITV